MWLWTQLNKLIHFRSRRAEADRLIAAAMASDWPTVDRLLSAGVEIDRRGALGNTALEEAVTRGALRVAVQLMERGAQPNIRRGAASLLGNAIFYRRWDLVEALMRFGADPRPFEQPDPILRYRIPVEVWNKAREGGVRLGAYGATLCALVDACEADQIAKAGEAVAGTAPEFVPHFMFALSNYRAGALLDPAIAGGLDPASVGPGGWSAADHAVTLEEEAAAIELTLRGAPLHKFSFQSIAMDGMDELLEELIVLGFDLGEFERLGDSALFRTPGSMLRRLKEEGCCFSDFIEDMLEKRAALGDAGELEEPAR